MVDASLIVILNKVMAIYGVVLIFCGIILNGLVFLVCVKYKELRSTSTFQFLAVAAINDAISCFPWNFNGFLKFFFSLRLHHKNLFYCEVIVNYVMWVSRVVTLVGFWLALVQTESCRLTFKTGRINISRVQGPFTRP